MYQINFVYKVKKPEKPGNFSRLKGDVLYRTMMAGPSIIVEKIPPLEVIRLPTHISGDNRVLKSQTIDPQVVNVWDTWAFTDFYRVMEYDVKVVEAFLNKGNGKVMARNKGDFLISVRKIF